MVSKGVCAVAAVALLLWPQDALTSGPADASACTAGAAKTAWMSFLRAFAAGNYARLDSMFAQDPDFGWYSANAPGLRRTAEAKNRATLVRYFQTRHRQHDRMNLLTFAYHGDGNFTYRLRRSALDYKSGAWFGLIGKGAVRCTGEAPQFVVVSLGGPGSDNPTRR